ncbi:aldose epimerase family protein [Tamlana crocina]
MKVLKRSFFSILLLAFIGLITYCKTLKKENQSETMDVPAEKTSAITKSEYGKMPDGTIVEQYVLKNANGVEMEVITYGGRITSLKVPNKDGESENVVLGFNNLDGYLGDNPYFGALIGRFGNRIAKGKFSLNGEVYSLATNNGPNHLHGGLKGFDRVVWSAEPIEGGERPALKLTYLSADVEEGYPGNLNVTVVYTLTNDNTLEVDYSATTDKATVINLTQHAYFNLTGDFSKDILNHEVAINAGAFLPVDGTLIPTGEIRKVAGTPFDFNSAKTVGKEINAENEQLELGNGYDHCWVLNGEKGNLRLSASAFDKESGRFMEVFSTEPGMQFYTGNFLDGTLSTPSGGVYAKRSGFCFETQHFPDSPNQKDFPSVVLKPGETYTSKTSFKFSVKKEE